MDSIKKPGVIVGMAAKLEEFQTQFDEYDEDSAWVESWITAFHRRFSRRKSYRSVVMTAEYILDLVANAFGLPKDQILQRKREEIYRTPRHVWMYYTRIFNIPTTQIQRDYGYHHSTVMHASNRISDFIVTRQRDIMPVIRSLNEQLNVSEEKPYAV